MGVCGHSLSRDLLKTSSCFFSSLIDQCTFLSHFQETHSLLECARISSQALQRVWEGTIYYGRQGMLEFMEVGVSKWVSLQPPFILSLCSILAESGWTVSQVISLISLWSLHRLLSYFLKILLFHKQWSRYIKKSNSLHGTEVLYNPILPLCPRFNLDDFHHVPDVLSLLFPLSLIILILCALCLCISCSK